MVLDVKTRGTLENEIDKAIKKIPDLAKLTQKEDFRKNFQVREESDFMVGIIWGYVLRSFQDFFVLDYNRLPNQIETLDAMSIVFKRTKEMKEAIFKCG